MEKFCIFLVACFLGFLIGITSKDAPPPIPTPSISIAVAPEGKPIQVNSSWSFCVADYDRDGQMDLWIIKQQATGTNSTELHIIKGPDFQKFILQTGTPAHETPNFVVPAVPEKG